MHRTQPEALSQLLTARAGTAHETETHKVGIPHAHDVLDAQLAHEEAVHPPERKLDELDAFLLEMCGERGCMRWTNECQSASAQSKQVTALLMQVFSERRSPAD